MADTNQDQTPNSLVKAFEWPLATNMKKTESSEVSLIQVSASLVRTLSFARPPGKEAN